jgi:hypothetical protein
MSRPIITVRTLGIALVSLLLCAIVASELPELLSLTDSAANDFTVRSADSLVWPVSHTAKIVRKAAINFSNSTQDRPFERLGALEKTELAPSLRLILYFVLRT